MADAISNIDRELQRVSEDDKQIDQIVKLLTSIPGIGKYTSLYMIAATKEFSMFGTSKQLASYVGVAPFPWGSGIKSSAPRVHKFANKKLKALLHMAALGQIKDGGEFANYYQRKKRAGKHGMSIINAIRYKLVKRIVSVVRRGTPYIRTKKKKVVT